MTFDFDKAAHSNPYLIPDGYFGRQDSLIYAAVGRYRRRRRIMRISIAASIAVLFGVGLSIAINADNFSSFDDQVNKYVAEASDVELNYATEIADAEMLFATDNFFE